MRDRRRHEDVAQVTIPMRAVEPYVPRAQRVAQVEHDRDFPEAGIIIALRPQLSQPFGMRSQEIVGRRNCDLGSDGGRSEESRVGKECVSPVRYRWSRYHVNKKTK